jgi:tryptophan-rich sensory protein
MRNVLALTGVAVAVVVLAGNVDAFSVHGSPLSLRRGLVSGPGSGAQQGMKAARRGIQAAAESGGAGDIMSMGVVSLDETPLPAAKKTPDYLAALSYLGATATEYTLLGVFLHVLQIGGVKVVRKLPESFVQGKWGGVTKNALLGVLFFALSVRSRIFSPLDNSRPKASPDDPNFQRLTPSWMPPPLAFPIVWTTIALLRTIASVLVVNAKGTLLCNAIFLFALHLAIGDTWNTINNVERRLGTSALCVLFVLGSVMAVVREYALVLPLAGQIIAPSAAWLTVATALVWSIWRLNYTVMGAPSLFPSKEEGPLSKWQLPFSTWNS